MGNNANSARAQMIKRTINYDAKAMTFTDKIKEFDKKLLSNRKSYEDNLVEAFDKFAMATDEAKMKMVTDAEKAYTKKFTDIFGKTKGEERAKAVLKELWRSYIGTPVAQNGGTQGIGMVCGPYGLDDIEEDEPPIDESMMPDYDGVYLYARKIKERTGGFGADENKLICTETQKTIKAKFGKETADKFKKALGTLYGTAKTCGLCYCENLRILQAATAAGIYKQLEKKDKGWLDKYLDGILDECKEAEETARKAYSEWKDWESNHL